MISRHLMVAAVALGAAVVAHPAFAQSITSAPPPSENLTRLQERVDELEDLLRKANAESERLSLELRRSNAEKARLQRLLDEAAPQQGDGAPGTGGPMTGGPSMTPAPTSAPLPAPSQRSGAAYPPPAAAGQLGTLPGSATVPSAPTADATTAFREARRLLDASRWPDAELALTSFLQTYPTAPDAPEARYFLGRTQIVLGRHGDAAATFVDFLRKSPTSARAPDAWVRLGMSLKGMGQTQQACATYRDLPAKYPNASAAVRELAVNQARLAQCPAR